MFAAQAAAACVLISPRVFLVVGVLRCLVTPVTRVTHSQCIHGAFNVLKLVCMGSVNCSDDFLQPSKMS